MTKLNKIILEVHRGCVEIVSSIPAGVELIIKDYDILEENETTKKDDGGVYEETSWTPADNEGILSRLKRGY